MRRSMTMLKPVLLRGLAHFRRPVGIRRTLEKILFDERRHSVDLQLQPVLGPCQGVGQKAMAVQLKSRDGIPYHTFDLLGPGSPQHPVCNKLARLA